MVGIEVLGLFSIRLALRMRKFNHKAAERSVEKAPIAQGYMAAATYLLSVLSLTVLLKISPELAVWSLIPLCLMGALADWIFALNGDHNEREAALRKIILEEQRAAAQADAAAQLLAQLADRDSMIKNLQTEAQAMQERVQSAKDLHTEQTRQFDAERQQLHTEIVKLAAQLDALRTMNMSQSPVLYTAQSVQIPAVDTAQTVKTPALYTEHDSEPVTFEDGRNKANEQKRTQKAHRQIELLQILFTELNGSPSDQLNKSALADRLHTTRVTIGRDIEELIDANRLSINGHINVL
jgi:cytochrome b561